METQKEKNRANLFAGVFGITCLIITAMVGYTITLAPQTEFMYGMAVTLIFTMWMVFVGVFTDLMNSKV
jgi:hypothetical protein